MAGGKEIEGEGMGGTSEEPWGAVAAAAVVVVLVDSLGTEGVGTTWAMGASTTTTDTVSLLDKEKSKEFCICHFMYKPRRIPVDKFFPHLPSFYTCTHIFYMVHIVNCE